MISAAHSRRNSTMAALALLLVSARAQQLIPSGFDTRGPVAPWVGRTLVDAQGVQAVGPVQIAPDKGPWSPQWIWVQPPSTAPAPNFFVARFRKRLMLPHMAAIPAVFAKISAEQGYRLWVNGRLVARGPDDAGSDIILPGWSHQWLYNQVDIGPYLRAGENTIAAEVWTKFLSNTRHGEPGFSFEASFAPQGDTVLTLRSDTSWEAEPAEAYAEGPHNVGLVYDARLDQPGWQDGAGAAWPSALAIQNDLNPLRPSQIPQAMEAAWPAAALRDGSGSHPPAPTVTLPGDGTFSVDYDRVLSAYFSVRLHGPAGTVVSLQPSEQKSAEGARRAARITLSGGETTFEFPDYDAFSTVKVTVTGASGPVTFDDLRATFVSQPVAYRGAFTCSDEALNKLWQAARWQTQINMQDRYLDSPNHQEPISDFGDYLIEGEENEYTFNAPALGEQDLRKFGAILDHTGSINFHTSYALLWLQMLLDDYDHTGDATLLRAEKATVDRLLDHFATFRGANGLLSEAPNYMFMDWGTLDGFALHHPPAAIGQGYLTAFYYRALADGTSIARMTGDTARAERYTRLRTEIADAFERALWDPKAGLYRDGQPGQNHQPLGRFFPADPVPALVTHTAQVNALAVLYGLAPRERQAPIMEKLATGLGQSDADHTDVQPYFMHFFFAAEVKAGVFDKYAVEQMHRWTLNPETHTFREEWKAGDWSHGWGGTPLVQLSAVVLGVIPAEPGYQRVSVAPHPAGLRFAEGSVPTALGDVKIAWHKEDRAFTLDIKTAAGQGVDIDLAAVARKGATLTVDGKPATVWQGGTFPLPGGSHALVLRSPKEHPTP
jgi:alpha-L-rhamnosidase